MNEVLKTCQVNNKNSDNHKFSLENVFQEILHRTENWINEGHGWIVELIEPQNINVLTYRHCQEALMSNCLQN